MTQAPSVRAAPNRVGEIHSKEVLMEDGVRYLIFYWFDDDPPPAIERERERHV